MARGRKKKGEEVSRLSQVRSRSVTMGEPVATPSLLRGAPLRIFTGNAHPALASRVASELGVEVSPANVSQFKNGEINVIVLDSVRDCDVFLINPTCRRGGDAKSMSPNDYLIELMLLCDSCRRAGAARVTVILPHYGYARQDQMNHTRCSVASRLVTDMLQTAGCDRIVTVTLHAPQIQGFATVPFENLAGLPILASYVERNLLIHLAGGSSEIVVVSPDAGGAKRAQSLAKHLNSSFALFAKTRERANEVASMTLVGDVRGKVCVLVDDMVDTGGTLTLAAKMLADHGAKDIIACCVHGVLSHPALDRIMACDALRELVVLDTIPLDNVVCPKLKVLSVATLLAEAVRRIHNGGSISDLYRMDEVASSRAVHRATALGQSRL